MSTESTAPKVSPNRSDIIPETYAIYVNDQHVHVWQYRVSISEPDGEWNFVETLDRDDEPELSLEYTTPMPPSSDGYWLYSKTYNCELDCE